MEKSEKDTSAVLLIVIFLLTLPMMTAGMICGFLFQAARTGFMVGREIAGEVWLNEKLKD